MDLIRASIEGLFACLKPEILACTIVKGGDGCEVLDRMIETVSHEHRNFTKSELDLLGSVVKDEWTVDKEFDIDESDHHLTLLMRLPVILNTFAKDVLVFSAKGEPCVAFNHLLRWRELSLAIGEDTLVIPWLARMDAVRKKSRGRFLWPNVLGHNYPILNALLETTLSDTHSHVHAAHDVFEFNWLGLMNFPKTIIEDYKEKEYFLRKGEKMEYEPVQPYLDLNLNWGQWVIMAAALRVFLFELLFHNNKSKSERISEKDIKGVIKDSTAFNLLLQKIKLNIESYQLESLKADGELIIDYAIRLSDFDFQSAEIPTSPYMIHHGERKLLYTWFSKYYSGNKVVQKSAQYLLLYLLLKTKIRREFTQTNDLVGFKNFQQYQQSKLFFIDRIKTGKRWDNRSIIGYKELVLRYAIQTSLGDGYNHYLEARVTPDTFIEYNREDVFSRLNRSIFGFGEFCEAPKIKDYLSFVIHFIKTDDKPNKESDLRHSKLRNELVECANEVGKLLDDDSGLLKLPLVGLDGASSELACRPEVMAPYFRYLNLKGLGNMTFHAGEDFFDIVDGLRTISETMDFMGYTTGCRIGHGLAMGVDANGYYSSRHNWLIIPRQILLDNLVWMKYFAASHNISLSASTELLIDDQFYEQLTYLGYCSNSMVGSDRVVMWDYWQAMRMRGDWIEHKEAILVAISECVKRSPVSPRSPSERISDLHTHYEYDIDCRNKGRTPISIQVPESFGEDVAKLQNALLDDIEQKGIVIETNPSSNLKIGRFSRYDQHPITIFHNVDAGQRGRAIMVTINTDDKGVFATSLKNEYSLIALALKKMKDPKGNSRWNDQQIEDYIKRIAHYSNVSRFQ